MKSYAPCLLIFIGFLLTGCGDARGSLPGGSPPHGQHVAGTFLALGDLLTWAGGCALAFGLLACAATFFPWTAFLSVFRSAFVEISVLGLGAALVGSAFLWVGDHPWVLGVTIGLVVLALAYRYRGWLVVALGMSLGKPAVKV